MKITGNEPASPIVSSEGVISSIGFIDKDNDHDARGLTIRQHFAAMAMQAIVSNDEWVKTMRIPDDWDEFNDRATRSAIEIADALIKRLNETPNPNE